MIANNKSKAMFTRGPIALAMDDMTTCKPKKRKNVIECDAAIHEWSSETEQTRVATKILQRFLGRAADTESMIL